MIIERSCDSLVRKIVYTVTAANRTVTDIGPIHITETNPGSTWVKLTQDRPRLVMLYEQESSVDPGWLQNKRARKFKFRKNVGHRYWESSSGCWILSPKICFENVGIG